MLKLSQFFLFNPARIDICNHSLSSCISGEMLIKRGWSQSGLWHVLRFLTSAVSLHFVILVLIVEVLKILHIANQDTFYQDVGFKWARFDHIKDVSQLSGMYVAVMIKRFDYIHRCYLRRFFQWNTALLWAKPNLCRLFSRVVEENLGEPFSLIRKEYGLSFVFEKPRL